MNLKEYSNDIENVSDAINKAFETEINFFAYRNPLDEMGVFGCSDKIDYTLSSEGFLVAPFIENNIYRRFVIPADFGLDFPIMNKRSSDYSISDTSTDKQDYIKSLEDLISRLKNNKVVISKSIVFEKKIDVGRLFKTLSELYPNAYIFCFYTSETGLWIGASPELLLKTGEKYIRTVALAGTRKSNSNTEWDSKNIIEQNIVTEYIVSVFKSNGLTPVQETVFTKIAGPVEHLCTPIYSEMNVKIDLYKLLSELSPTPALCGYPKDYALQEIFNIEDHQRKYYGGYIGIVTGSEASLYVNLRSLNYDGNKMQLFSGGGITVLSNAESEWQETEIKSETLLMALEQ